MHLMSLVHRTVVSVEVNFYMNSKRKEEAALEKYECHPLLHILIHIQ